jgi:PAS domain-containing protein
VPLASSQATHPARIHAVRADDPIAPAAAALRTQRAGLASIRTEPTSVLTVPLRGCRRALGSVVFEGVRVEPGDDISVLNRADELGRQLSSAIETVQLLGVVGQARRELEQLFASIALPIVVIDGQGQIIRANQAFAAAVRRPADSLRAQPLESCVGPELVSWLNDPHHPAGTAVEGEVTDSVLGGPYFVTVTDLVTDDGSHSGRVIVARGI